MTFLLSTAAISRNGQSVQSPSRLLSSSSSKAARNSHSHQPQSLVHALLESLETILTASLTPTPTPTPPRRLARTSEVEITLQTEVPRKWLQSLTAPRSSF